ncbi:hypothetical protein [Nocardia sp. CA-290969]|uniref:hypothetical protein n=1 Tax=Nocardia sp. CA-290969 TaxID=3239986 RepID=UPI003D91DD0D
MNAVTHHMGMGRLQITQNWVGPVWSLVGIGQVIASALNPIELAICVGQIEEVTPAAVADFTRSVDQFSKSLRRAGFIGVKGGSTAVAALVSERVHPAALPAVRNKPMSFGSVVVPAVVDLGQRQLHIATNTPMIGMAVWGGVRDQARTYLPEPRAVFG